MPDKERERWYFGRLQEAIPLLGGNAIEPEPPDFVVTVSGKRLGLELTVFHLPPSPGESPYQEQQSLRDRIVESAERLHAAAGGPPLYVGIIFHDRFRLTKKDVGPLAEAIANSVLVAPVPESMAKPVQLPWGRLPEQTAGIMIHPSVDGRDKLWNAYAGGWVADITQEHVSAVIRAKERSVPLARTRCDELWLVIVHDLFSNSAQAELTEAARDAEYLTILDRVLWFTPHIPAVTYLRSSRLPA